MLVPNTHFKILAYESTGTIYIEFSLPRDYRKSIEGNKFIEKGNNFILDAIDKANVRGTLTTKDFALRTEIGRRYEVGGSNQQLKTVLENLGFTNEVLDARDKLMGYSYKIKEHEPQKADNSNEFCDIQ